MKKLFTLVLALASLGAFTGLALAQEEAAPKKAAVEKKADVETKTDVERTTEAGKKVDIEVAELQTSQTFEAGVMPHCPKPPVQYLGGVVDNFGGGPDPVTKSPEVTAFLAAHPALNPTRLFDQPGADKVFVHSFKMKENCKVCAVKFEAKMRDYGDFSPPGDRIHIYGKTIDAAGLIWTAPTTLTGPGTSAISTFLPTASITALNQHIFANAPGHWLNVIAQDDHAFDYVRLTIWYH
ncbi:MAG: hypothetical protein QOC70_2776 [Verrucomicrobiota bacterium]|jgi:hypothetical protein